MRRALVLTLVILCMCMPYLYGQIPHTVSYQGVLTDANGNAVPDGNVSLTFRLFDLVSGGTALWQETQQVAVSKGVFNAILGSSAPLNVPFDKPYWLGITVGQGTELTPRVALAASPYSLNSHSTIAEPAQGQGLTIRDIQGNATHVFNASGEALHTAKSTIRIPSSAGADTALVIINRNGPAIVALSGDSITIPLSTKRDSKLSELKPVAPHGQIVRSLDAVGITAGGEIAGVSGGSVTGDGVRGSAESGDGVDGLSITGNGGNFRSVSGPGIRASGFPAGIMDGEFQINTVNIDPNQERILVWSQDNKVRYRILPAPGVFDGVLQGKAFVVKSATGTEVFRVDTNGTSLHKGDETFEGDVILKGQSGKGAKLVDATGKTLAGFGRIDSATNQRLGVYGKAEKTGDLAGAFDGNVDINGEIYASSLHIVRGVGDTVMHFNADGTSEHGGLETFKAGLQTVLTNGNILRINPSEGLTLKTATGQFRGHMDPNGNAFFFGNVSKGGGSFKIDHPLDPANKYLYHSFVESPDMMNIYNGNVTLDGNGEAIVELPGWFEALNKDFRYQLTSIGVYAPLFVADEVVGNRFKIAGGKPNQRVSWQVTGIRKDAYAEMHRIPIEESKPAADRGRYLHPEAFGLPKEMGVSMLSE